MESIDYSAAKFYLSFVELIGILAIGVYTYYASRNRARKQQVNELQSDLKKLTIVVSHIEEHQEKADEVIQRSLELVSELEKRLATVETKQAAQPTHEDVGKVYDRLHHTNRALDTLTGEMSGVKHQLSLMLEHLMNKKGTD